MKKKLLFIFAFIALMTPRTNAITDTLKHYSSGGSTSSYSFTTFYRQYARFEPKAPGYITQIKIRMGGAAGTFKLHILGHEAGTPTPLLRQDLMTPVKLTKSGAGYKNIVYILPQPVWVDNNQFFVGIDSVVGNMSWARDFTDRTIANNFCSSITGGDYLYQSFDSTSGTTYQDVYTFIADVAMNYPTLTSANYFQDVTTTVGINNSLPNWSVAWSDYNDDGYQDAMVSGTLYKNNGNGTFSDVSGTSGITGIGGLVSNMFVDMNNDGKMDIIALNGTSNFLFTNNGGGTFTKTALSLANLINISSLNFGDLNKDKFPDMFVGQLWNGYPNPLPNYFYYNSGSLTFNDNSSVFANSGMKHSRGSSFVDYDNDGDLDLYVANYYLFQDELYRNNGDGTFTDICQSKGIDVTALSGSSHGTGVDWTDFDNDGDMDLLLPQLCHPPNLLQYDHRPTTIYKNTGMPNYDFNDTYDDVLNKNSIGVEYEETNAGGSWADINSDGLMDFAITVFYGCRYVDVYLQKSDHTFELKTFDFGITQLNTGEEVSFADFNNDGKLDMMMGDNSAIRFFKNTMPTGNFTEIDLQSTTGNNFAIGSHITLYAGGVAYMQEVKAGRGVRMQNPYRLFFGLGTNTTIDSAVVKWPMGNKEKFVGLNINKMYKLIEGGQVILSVFPVETTISNLDVYPNPSKNETTFSYELANSQHVNLEVYSLFGQKVAALINENQFAGKHAISWLLDNNEIVSGVYIYKFTTDGIVKSGKIVIE